MACNDKNAFFTSEQPKRYKLWSCQKMCDALHYLLENIFIRFGSKLYGQIVGIPMLTNCAPLVADLFLFCYERDFMLSLSDNTSLQCYSVLSDILVKNELCIPLERGSNVLSTGEGFICLSPPSKLKIAVHFCCIYKKTISFSAIVF